LNVIGAANRQPWPAHAPALTGPRFEIQPLKDLAIRDLKPALGIFLAAVAVVLLIVCANVANLLIARAVIRQRELALRQSLGASRTRIVRALLAEGFALSILSWLAACAAALLITRSLSGYLAPNSMGAAVMMPDFTPDWTVLGYALVLAMFATIACTIAPVLRAWCQPLLAPLKTGEQTVIQGRSKVTRVLVVVQLAFSVVLVTCAGLVYRSLFLVGSFESGFNTAQLMLVTVNTAGSATNPQTNAALLETLRTGLANVRGLTDVSFARQAPRENWGVDEVRLPGVPDVAARAEINFVGPHYLQTIGTGLLAGRDPSSDVGVRTVPAAMISQKLAQQLWPGQSPVGRTIVVGDRGQQLRQIEIAGVIPDRYYSGFRREMRSFVFLSEPHHPSPPGESTLYVRYRGTFSEIAPAVARTLQEIDSRTAIAFMRTWDTQVDAGIWPVRVLTTLLMLFAAGSLLIAAIGQYALVSFDMRRRVREVGLRMALGASARQVLTTIIREGFALTLIGLVVGFLLSLAVGRAISGVLYGITPTDPATYAGVFLLLTATSLLACYLPARRAARINPTSALRTE
jgi:predicted permease